MIATKMASTMENEAPIRHKRRNQSLGKKRRVAVPSTFWSVNLLDSTFAIRGSTDHKVIKLGGLLGGGKVENCQACYCQPVNVVILADGPEVLQVHNPNTAVAGAEAEE